MVDPYLKIEQAVDTAQMTEKQINDLTHLQAQDIIPDFNVSGTRFRIFKGKLLKRAQLQQGQTDMEFLVKEFDNESRFEVKKRFPNYEVEFKNICGKRAIIFWPEGIPQTIDEVSV